MKKVEIFTDGSCLGNPGKGGLGILMRYKGVEKKFSQGYFHTTNNRMELLAPSIALKKLKEPCEVIITSDSQYVKNGIEKWIFNWKKNGWKSANKQDVKNKDLWVMLDEAISHHKVSWQWVKGHSGQRENEICDELARNAANNPTLNDISAD